MRSASTPRGWRLRSARDGERVSRGCTRPGGRPGPSFRSFEGAHAPYAIGDTSWTISSTVVMFLCLAASASGDWEGRFRSQKWPARMDTVDRESRVDPAE